MQGAKLMASFTGTSWADHLIGTVAADTIRGYGGNDILEGRGGDDRILGGPGNDTLIGGRGNDTLSGGTGSDVFKFSAGAGRDVITDLGVGEVVKISGYASAQSLIQVNTSVVLTLSSTDQITFLNSSVATVQAALHFGSDAATGSIITGTNEGDLLNGTGANDIIKGLGGYDVIHGGAGNDLIYGGLSGDRLYGDAGSDTFVYTSLADAPPYGLMYYESDTIADWQSTDRIDLSTVDANPGLAGQQHFHFAGYTDGSLATADHSPGALYIAKDAGYVWLTGYTDGGAYGTFYIGIEGQDALTFTASDLIL
jgi:Ca2+-binding RTX toxin-like protein